MLHIFILLLLSTSEVRAFVSRSTERGTVAKRSLLPNERSSVPPPKQRVITPNDIASLFGGGVSKSKLVEEDDYDFEDEDEVTEMETSSVSPKTDDNPAVVAELERLETISFSRSSRNSPPRSVPKREPSVPIAPDMEYLDLDVELIDQKLENARSSLSLMEEDEISSRIDAPRVFMYDPTESTRMYDPMKFGAYARWKQAADQVERANKKNAKRKRKEGLSPDSFYNAIKNLGSGPKAKDVPTGVGVADPPRGKSPITPKKAPVKKNKKKTITPDEIDSLFESKSRSENESLSSDDSSAVESTAFNPMLRDDEPVPQWIIDAERAAKIERRMRGKKQKKLTDDWRFWAAIIAAAGFGAAFFSVYQQTGGFGGGLPSIGGFDPSNDAAGQEFVI